MNNREPYWVLSIWNGDNEVFIPESVQNNNYRIRSLRYLVNSAADSFTFLRDGDEVKNVTEEITDTPWRKDVGDLIIKYFKFELLLYMPQGKWQLGVKDAA